MGLGAVGFYPALEHFWPLLVVNILFGIGLALVLPYIEVIALEQIGKERYGKIRLFGSLGFIAVALVLVKVHEFTAGRDHIFDRYGSCYLVFRGIDRSERAQSTFQ